MPNRSKVLIVDDHVANQELVAMVIEHLDVNMYFASSGEEAVHLAHVHRFAVILMDVSMPGMNGIEATKEILGNDPSTHVPIIMVTATEVSDQRLVSAYDAGAVDYVLKPIQPVVLISKVRQFVEVERQTKLNHTVRREQDETNSRLQALLHSAGEGILGVDMVGKITFANPKAAAILTIEQPALLQLHVEDFLLADEGDESSWELSTLYSFILGAVSGHCDTERWHRQGGEPFYIEYTCEPMKDPVGKVIGCVVMFQDISKRKETEENLKYLATYDQLTDLMNRAYFYDSLKKAISRSRRTKSPLCILMLDLDHFKLINDTYGHDGGDILLTKVSERLMQCVRDGDVVARLGGDEFGLILYDVKSEDCVHPVAKKIIRAVSQDVELPSATINVSCSVGFYLYSDFSVDLNGAVKNADTALYEAKEQGRNNYQVFVPHMRQDMMEKQRIQMMLQRAVAEEEFTLVYQPKVSLARQQIVGCEALLRWKPKNGDAIGPDVFIPIAEESGLIVEIGEWVLNEACWQVRVWHDLGVNVCSIAVNVSMRQLRSGDFHKQIIAAFKRYSVTPSMIELEITETGALEDQARIIPELNRIHEMGVRIAIDDFGVGNASLDYLRKLPLKLLKIDRSFVVDIGSNAQDEEIIRVMMAVSHTMELDVVAEGVETIQQLCFFAENKCDLIQGYYFSRPVSAQNMTKLLMLGDRVFEEQFAELREHLRDSSVVSGASAQKALERVISLVTDFVKKGSSDSRS